MKGIYNCRPPQPRYAATWDVGIVTAHIQNLGPDANLSLKQLSQKLVMLMALVEASRTSELGALDIRFRVFKPEGVLFRLPSLTKKRKVGAPPREIFFGAYPPEERLCVVETLKNYEARTKQYRGSGDATKENKLLLSYVKPHKPVTSQRIAHWIKDLLQDVSSKHTQLEVHLPQQHTLRVYRCRRSCRQLTGPRLPRLSVSTIVHLRVPAMQ